jgi:hypothetical protein
MYTYIDINGFLPIRLGMFQKWSVANDARGWDTNVYQLINASYYVAL